MPNTREMRIEQVEDILAKWEFFYGQRAGRELWAEKPKDVQEKDIEAFNRDISFVRDFVRGVTIQKWIPVTERLPEIVAPYLVLSRAGNCSVQWFLIHGENFKGFFYAEEPGKITHWMPLPERPANYYENNIGGNENGVHM